MHDTWSPASTRAIRKRRVQSAANTARAETAVARWRGSAQLEPTSPALMSGASRNESRSTSAEARNTATPAPSALRRKSATSSGSRVSRVRKTAARKAKSARVSTPTPNAKGVSQGSTKRWVKLPSVGATTLPLATAPMHTPRSTGVSTLALAKMRPHRRWAASCSSS